MFAQFGINAGYVEDLHAKWLQSPQSVDEKWRRFFSEHEAGKPAIAQTKGNGTPKRGNGNGASAVSTLRLELPHDTLPPPSLIAGAEAAGRVYALINAYRVRGHLYANLSPLEPPRRAGEELALVTFGLSQADLDLTFPTINVTGLPERTTLLSVLSVLAVLAIVYYYRQIASASWLVSATLGMQLGGAFGNLLDRVTQGYVVDFVDVGVGEVRFWAFNVADSSIVVGIFVVTFALWYEERRVARPKRA